MKTLRTICFLAVLLIFAAACHEKQASYELIRGPGLQAFASWSPDGRYIVYQHTDMNDTMGLNGLWRVRPDGSQPEQLIAGVAEHPKWSPDNRYIVFDADTGKSIKMIPVNGGDPVSFLPDSIGIMNGGLPCWSPGGGQIAFIEGKTMSLCIFDLENKTGKRIFHAEGNLPLPGCWTPDGDSVMVALMNMETRRSVIEVVASDGSGSRQIKGHHENLYRYLAISPDGKLLIYAAMEDGRLGLYIMPSEGGNTIPIASDPEAHIEGVSWAPDGKKIAFNRMGRGDCDIRVMKLNTRKLLSELASK